MQLIDGTIRYTGHRPGHPTTNVWLPNFAFESGNILIDPALPPTRQRPLLAKVLTLNLDGATYMTGDSLKALTFGQLRLAVGDSVLVARNVKVGPALSDAAWMRRQKVRQTLGRAQVDSIIMRGVNYDHLIVRTTLEARDMAVSGVRVRLQKDMALPAPRPHEERTSPALDSTLADLGLPTHIARMRAPGRRHVYRAPSRVARSGVPHRQGHDEGGQPCRSAVALGGDRRATKETSAAAGAAISLLFTDVNRHWGAVRSLAVGRVAMNFGDSTLTVDSIRIAPHFSPKPRRTSVKIALDSLRFTGVDFVRLADGHGGSDAAGDHRQRLVRREGRCRHTRTSQSSARPRARPAFTGIDLPMAIRDLRILRGHGLFTQVAPDKAPIVVTVGGLSATGTGLRLQRGVTRPLVEQNLVLRVADVSVSGDPAHVQAGSAVINLGDSTISLHARHAAYGRRPRRQRAAGSTVTMAVDSVRLGGLHLAELERGKAAHAGRVSVGTVELEVRHVGSARDSAKAETDRETGGKEGLPVSIADLRVPVVHFRYVDVKPDGKQSVITVKKAGVLAEGVVDQPGSLA